MKAMKSMEFIELSKDRTFDCVHPIGAGKPNYAAAAFEDPPFMSFMLSMLNPSLSGLPARGFGMKRALCFLVIVLAVLGPVGAMDHALDPLASGRAALEEGLPSVALAKLSPIKPQDLTPSQLAEREILLVRASLLAGDPITAAALLASTTSKSKDFAFWSGETNAALGNFEKALAFYQAAMPGMESGLGAARMLTALGRPDDAMEVLNSLEQTPHVRLELAALLLDRNDPTGAMSVLQSLGDIPGRDAARRDYLLATAVFRNGDPANALKILDRPSKPDAALALRSSILRAACLAESGDRDGAEVVLEKFVESHPSHPDLSDLFMELDRLYASQKSPSSSELRRWSEDPVNSSRAALALYFVARNEQRLNRADRSESAYAEFLSKHPNHQLSKNARIELSSLALAGNKPTEALKALGGVPGADMDFYRGLAFAAGGDYAAASTSFENAAKSSGWETARFNAALSGILAGKPVPTFAGNASLNSELRLAMALDAAQRRDPKAAELLEKVAQENISPWSETALLALAEWKYLQLDLEGARKDILRISSSGNPATIERAGALDVFLHDDGTPDSEPKVVMAAETFLTNNPSSPLRAEVLMKLGEIHFRRGDYLSAQSSLTKAAEANPGSAIAEKARFLAAQAASRSMSEAGTEEALELYEVVARSGGPLALRSRLAQALLLNALGRPKESIPVLEKILESGPDEELRYAALIEKGDTYFGLGDSDPTAYPEAIAAWRLAFAPEVPSRWRNQALVKIGAASERLGELPAALASYHDVLSAKPDEEPEYFWFYKAGFDAVRILESQARIDEAIVIYEKLAARDGPRSEEARQRLNALRLENFLWEEKAP